MHSQSPVFKSFKIVCLCLFFFFSFPSYAEKIWVGLSDGIQYLDLADNQKAWSHIHLFNIDLQKNKLRLIMAKDMKQRGASVEEIKDFNQVLIAINGGFFDQNYQPLGLRIQNHQQKNAFKPISWWGVFMMKHGKPLIQAAKNYHEDNDIALAIQSGPRLLIDGEIPSLKPGLAERTALCITENHHIILAITENYAISTTDLAKKLKEAPLNCLDAINFDGGGSSQVYAKIGDFKIHVPGFSKIADALVVESRTSNNIDH